jgi:hypothetical protein
MSRSRNWAPLILFAFIGLGVVIGLMAQSSHPDDHSGKPFGVGFMLTVAAGIFVLLLWQAGWQRRNEDAYVEERVALALGADAEEVRRAARAQLEPGRYSAHTGRIMTVLVLVIMTPAVLLQNPRLTVLGAIPIVGYCLYLCARLLMRGGGLDQAYASVDREFAPLGLRMVQRPNLRLDPQMDGRMNTRMEGPMVFEGTRHDRAVRVQVEGGTSTVHVAVAAPDFKARSRDGRLTAEQGDERLQRALAELPASNRWTGVKLSGDRDGITIRRRTKSNESWVYDLWLAEALAGAIS